MVPSLERPLNRVYHTLYNHLGQEMTAILTHSYTWDFLFNVTFQITKCLLIEPL